MHLYILAGGLTPVAGEEILPRLGIKIDAVETEGSHIGDPLPGRLLVAVKRLEEIAEPEA
jgi:hypothetical protein